MLRHGNDTGCKQVVFRHGNDTGCEQVVLDVGMILVVNKLC